jgi:hypothetical protein
MKKFLVFLCAMVLMFGVMGIANAFQVKLTIESYFPAKLPIVSTVIEIANLDDQQEISRQAGLLAMSEEGWNLQELVDQGNLIYEGVPEWIGGLYTNPDGYFSQLRIYVDEGLSSIVNDFYGYELNDEARNIINSILGSPHYSLYFHTDIYYARGGHDVGETDNNFGVISGAMNGLWAQCPVPDWGRFFVEQIELPNVEMNITKMKVDLKTGKFEIKGYLDISSPYFDNLVFNPQSRLLLELQTDDTESNPIFDIVGEDQVELATDDNWKKLKFRE